MFKIILLLLFTFMLVQSSDYDRANKASKEALKGLDCEFEECKPEPPKVIIKEKIVIKEVPKEVITEKVVEKIVYKETPEVQEKKEIIIAPKKIELKTSGEAFTPHIIELVNQTINMKADDNPVYFSIKLKKQTTIRWEELSKSIDHLQIYNENEKLIYRDSGYGNKEFNLIFKEGTIKLKFWKRNYVKKLRFNIFFADSSSM